VCTGSPEAQPEAQPYPGLHQKKCGQQGEGEDSAALLCSGDTQPSVLCPALGSPVQDRHGTAEAGPEEGHENYQRDGTPLCEEQLRELRLLSLAKGRLQGNLRAALQYSKGAL